MDVQDLEACEPRAGSLAYAAYLASMAMHGNQADVAGAFLINFPVFGTNAARMGRALQRPPDDLDSSDLGFFRFFGCLIYTSPSPRDATRCRMPSSA